MYTYTPGGTSNVDYLRLIIPDRLNDDLRPPAVFTDEELEASLTLWGDIFSAAASCCEQIAMDKAKQAMVVTLEAGSGGSAGGRQLVTIDKRQVPTFFLQRAKELKQAAQDAVAEHVDSFDYLVNHYGEIVASYVGNEMRLVDPWHTGS
jgi:hypothetical protein